MRRSAMAGLVVAAALAGTGALAGYKNGWEVGVDLTNLNAYGTVGTVRNSADSTQYVGCSVRAYDGDPNQYVYCSARTSSGVTANCSTTSAAVADVARSITTDSHIYFSWNTSGTCTYLYVSNQSSYAPKQP